MTSNNNRGSTIYQKASTSEKTLESTDSSNHGNFFTVGKIDAGIAVLISDSVHLIEFPSLLLPAGVGPGSIVNISCTRNFTLERETTNQFWELQQEIFKTFGEKEPVAPKLRVRNTTQTSVTLEWDKLDLAQSKLLGLSIWRNNQRLTTIPNPLHNTSTKLSGLSLDSDYTFHLVLKTSAGTFNSQTIKIHTHTISDTSGISVCFGLIEPKSLLEEAKNALDLMKAKSFDKIQIDTTHFVATSPASISNPRGGPGVEYQKAMQLSIPVVSPEWVIACAREKKMVPIANYYSVGTTNHAASISSATLVTPAGSIPLSSGTNNNRRAAAISEAQEEEEEQVVVVPEREVEAEVVQRKVIEEEIEVEGPPRDQVVEREIVNPKVSQVVEEPIVEAPKVEEEVVEEPDLVEDESPVLKEEESVVEKDEVAAAAEEDFEDVALDQTSTTISHPVPTIEVSSPGSTDDLSSTTSTDATGVERIGHDKKLEGEEGDNDEMEEIGL